MTEPLSDEMIHRISPIRGAYSDIRPVIDYYRVTNENRLLFGAATPFIEHIPLDLEGLEPQPDAEDFPVPQGREDRPGVGRPDGDRGQPVPADRHPQWSPQRLLVQGYSGFGVTPSHIICKVLAEGMSEGSSRYDLVSSVKRGTILGKDHIRPLLLTAGKSRHQLSGYWSGRR